MTKFNKFQVGSSYKLNNGNTITVTSIGRCAFDKGLYISYRCAAGRHGDSNPNSLENACGEAL